MTPATIATPTAISSTSMSTVHGLRVAVIDPPVVHRVCLAAMGFGAWLDPFEVQRFQRLGRLLQARFLLVESPGLGYPGTRLTAQEAGALLRGRYQPLARRMLAAALSEINDELPVHLLGYSMGTSIAAAMATPSRLPVEVSSVTLIEPVAVRRWTPAALVRAVQGEDRLIDSYLMENAQTPGYVAPSDRVAGGPTPVKHGLDQVLLSSALSWGRLRTDLVTAAAAHPHLSVLVLHGRTSLLSPVREVTGLVENTRAAGLTVTGQTFDGSHGLWQSLPRVDELANHVRSLWDTVEQRSCAP